MKGLQGTMSISDRHQIRQVMAIATGVMAFAYGKQSKTEICSNPDALRANLAVENEKNNLKYDKGGPSDEDTFYYAKPVDNFYRQREKNKECNEID